MTRPSEDRQQLNRRRECRYRLLRGIYDSTNGSSHAGVNMWELGEELGLSRDEIDDAVAYLDGEGLLNSDLSTMGGGIAISHAGIREVEASIERPDRPTDHFPVEIITNYNTYNGPVITQHGSHSTASIVQNTGVDGGQLAVLLEQAREAIRGLPLQQQEEAFDLVRVVEQESKAPKPEKAMLITALRGLRDFAELAKPVAEIARVVGPFISS